MNKYIYKFRKLALGKKKICKKCGETYLNNSGRQIYCGSSKKKIGCSYINYLKIKHKHKYEYKKSNKYPKWINKWYQNQPRICFYCGVKEEDLLKYLSKRYIQTKKLTIDRIDSNKGYELTNIVLACMRCNILKADFFTKDEFLEIADKYIKPKLK